MVSALTTVLVAVAKPPPDDKVSPGLLGFLVTFALVLVTILLMRSMVGHLRKVRYAPDAAPERPDTRRAETQRPDTQRPDDDRRSAAGGEDARTEASPPPRDVR